MAQYDYDPYGIGNISKNDNLSFYMYNYNYSTYEYDYEYPADTSFHGYDTKRLIVIILGSLISLWVVAFNLVMITGIIRHRQSHHGVFHWIVLNLCSTFLAFGVLLIPLAIVVDNEHPKTLNETVCKAWFKGDFLISGTICFSLFSLSVERLLNSFGVRIRQTLRNGLLFVLLPWIPGIVLVILDEILGFSWSCEKEEGKRSRHVYILIILKYFLPALLVAVVYIATIVFRVLRWITLNSNQNRSLNDHSLGRILAVVLISLVFLGMTFLESLVILFVGIRPDVRIDRAMSSAAMYLYFSSPAFAQMAWLLDNKLRSSFFRKTNSQISLPPETGINVQSTSTTCNDPHLATH